MASCRRALGEIRRARILGGMNFNVLVYPIFRDPGDSSWKNLSVKRGLGAKKKFSFDGELEVKFDLRVEVVLVGQCACEIFFSLFSE